MTLVEILARIPCMEEPRMGLKLAVASQHPFTLGRAASMAKQHACSCRKGKQLAAARKHAGPPQLW